VSFALAVLTLGVLVILGYKLLGNIFAADQATGQKVPIKIGLSNWDGDPVTKNSYSEDNQALYFKYVTDKKYRCDTVTIYLADAVNGTSDQDKIQKNREKVKEAAQQIAEASGLDVYGSIKYEEGVLKGQKKTDAEIGSIFKKTVIIPGAGYRCQGTGTDSVSYGVSFVIPAEYQNTPASATSTSTTTTTPGSPTTTGEICVTRASKSQTYKKYADKNESKFSSDPPIVKEWERSDGDNSDENPKYLYQADTGKLYKNIQDAQAKTNDFQYVSGACEGTSDTDLGNNSFYKEVKVGVSVKTQEGLAVESARVQIERLDQLNKVVTGTSTDYVTTDKSGNAETTIKIAGTDSEKIKQIQATAQKLNQTQSKQVAWSGQSEVSFQFVLNLSSTEAGTEQNWTATGGEEPYIAPIIDYDAKWPGGPNSIDLIAVRRSMHNANYNGYTPVGGVEFYINVYTNAPPATTRKTQNTLGAEKALAQDDDGDNTGGAQIPPLGNNEYGFKETNNNYQNSGAGNTPVGAPLPYNQSEVTPYNSSLLRALREKNQTKYSYGSRGRIVDNGLNSGVTIGNLPSGIYDIELRKSNFYSSRFILFVNNSNGAKKISLPIAPRTYAEPPSIDSGKIDKQPNKDVYSAKGYVYVSKYPWFGWQKENEYIYQKPYIANGVPTTMGDNGQPIGGIYGSPEMQACIGKKMQSVGVGVSGLSMKDVLLGAGGAYLLKQSGKQNDDWVKGGMIAGGIYSLIELAKSSEAKVNINYDQFDCAELLYGGRSTVPMGCETCFMNVDGANQEELQRQARANCDPRCMLQYSPLMNVTSLLPFGNLFGNK